jgi:hypothetical protein
VNGPSRYVKGEELAEHAEDLIKQGDPRRPGARLGGPRARARDARRGRSRSARDIAPRCAWLLVIPTRIPLRSRQQQRYLSLDRMPYGPPFQTSASR